MRAIIQRVTSATVKVDGKAAGTIGEGFLVLLGITGADTPAHARVLAGKTVKLRIFHDDGGKMNRSLLDTGGKALVVSQFTLYADTAKGNRPSFINAASPPHAEWLYELYCVELTSMGIGVGKGVFGAHMEVSLVNDGPVTICLDTDEWKI